MKNAKLNEKFFFYNIWYVCAKLLLVKYEKWKVRLEQFLYFWSWVRNNDKKENTQRK